MINPKILVMARTGTPLARSSRTTAPPVFPVAPVVPEERGGFSSLAASPEAGRLREYLRTPRLIARQGSIFDLPPLNLGRTLHSLDADDDLLSEMLDDTRF